MKDKLKQELCVREAAQLFLVKRPVPVSRACIKQIWACTGCWAKRNQQRKVLQPVT